MEIKKQNRLSFNGVDILNVNFNVFSPRVDEMKIDVNFDPKVFFPDDNQRDFKIIMDVELKSEDHFELQLRAVGNFQMEQEIDDEIRKNFINTNAPAIMFPYVRSFITTLSSNMGESVGALIIPTQFFSGELKTLNKED